MEPRTIANGIVRALALITGIAFFAYFLFKIQSVIAYLIIASVVALLGRPIALFLRKSLKFSNTLAALTTLLFMLSLFLGVIALFIPLISQQSKNLSLLDFEALKANIKILYLETVAYLGIDTSTLSTLIDEYQLGENLLKALDFGAIPDLLNSFLSALSNFSIGLFSVLFISFFFLKDSNLFQKGLLTFVPDSKESKLVKSMEKTKGLLSRYFAGIVLQLFILFVIYTLVLLLVGVDYAVVIAFLCALFNIIPYLGPIIGGTMMITLTMTSFVEANFSEVILPKALYVLIGVLIGQLIDNFFSQPFIFSNRVKSHPLEIFLIIIIAGLLFGIVGMIIAVPAYTTLKVILKEFLAENSFVKKLTKNL